jgi:hypothetical protein
LRQNADERRHAEKMNFSKAKEPDLRGPLPRLDAKKITHPPAGAEVFLLTSPLQNALTGQPPLNRISVKQFARDSQ